MNKDGDTILYCILFVHLLIPVTRLRTFKINKEKIQCNMKTYVLNTFGKKLADASMCLLYRPPLLSKND